MIYEAVTKVLEVDPKQVAEHMVALGAQQVLRARLTVEYFRLKGAQTGEEQSYLLLRSFSEGLAEVSWNGPSQIVGISRMRSDINFLVSDAAAASELFDRLGYKRYAVQEKDRVSWVHDGWRFDLDKYPEIPAYIKIKGHDDQHLQEAIQLLGLQDSRNTSDLDRVIIQFTYHKDWYDLRFPGSQSQTLVSEIDSEQTPAH